MIVVAATTREIMIEDDGLVMHKNNRISLSFIVVVAIPKIMKRVGAFGQESLNRCCGCKRVSRLTLQGPHYKQGPLFFENSRLLILALKNYARVRPYYSAWQCPTITH